MKCIEFRQYPLGKNWVMKVLVISLLVCAALAGDCINTGTVNIGDTIGDGPGDYENEISEGSCTWTFGPPATDTYLALRFSEFHIEVSWRRCIFIRGFYCYFQVTFEMLNLYFNLEGYPCRCTNDEGT